MMAQLFMSLYDGRPPQQVKTADMLTHPTHGYYPLHYFVTVALLLHDIFHNFYTNSTPGKFLLCLPDHCIHLDYTSSILTSLPFSYSNSLPAFPPSRM